MRIQYRVLLLQICENGLISFNRGFCGINSSQSSPPLIAGFWGDIDISKTNYNLSVFYNEISEESNTHRFNKSKTKINELLNNGINCQNILNFEPTHIFIATWRNVKGTLTDDEV